MNNRFYTTLGWIATVTVANNLKGDKADWIQPMVAVINCTF